MTIRLLIPFLLLIGICCNAQKVKNTSYVSGSGEKVLRLEFTLPFDQKTAWKLFTTNEELKKWVAPIVHIDLSTGGFMLTNYDSTKTLEDSSTIELGIVNYIDNEMLTYKINLNSHFSAKARREDGNLQEIVQFKSAGKRKTKIISSMVGWGKGSDWDKTYDFFTKGNTWTYEEMLKVIK